MAANYQSPTIHQSTSLEGRKQATRFANTPKPQLADEGGVRQTYSTGVFNPGGRSSVLSSQSRYVQNIMNAGTSEAEVNQRGNKLCAELQLEPSALGSRV
ncbi:MAG: hypothetical protein Q9171_006581 [Xanthocarpia ochracea]